MMGSINKSVVPKAHVTQICNSSPGALTVVRMTCRLSSGALTYPMTRWQSRCPMMPRFMCAMVRTTILALLKSTRLCQAREISECSSTRTHERCVRSRFSNATTRSAACSSANGTTSSIIFACIQANVPLSALSPAASRASRRRQTWQSIWPCIKRRACTKHWTKDSRVLSKSMCIR